MSRRRHRCRAAVSSWGGSDVAYLPSRGTASERIIIPHRSQRTAHGSTKSPWTIGSSPECAREALGFSHRYSLRPPNNLQPCNSSTGFLVRSRPRERALPARGGRRNPIQSSGIRSSSTIASRGTVERTACPTMTCTIFKRRTPRGSLAAYTTVAIS